MSRVMVIGLDGATFDALSPWANCGWTPNLGRLLRTAVRANLTSTDPFITPTAWATFLTGVDPVRHGVFDYRYLDHRRGTVLLNHAGRLACPTLFDAIANAQGEVVSLNLPMTYPVASPWRGVIVGGLDSPSLDAALSAAPVFARKLQALGVPFDLNNIWRRRPRTYEELSERIARTCEVFRGRTIAAKLADRLSDWRLMIVQYQTLDALQHYCWPYLGFDEQAPRDWTDKACTALVALDQSVGDLLELAEQRGATVLAVSDHGFGPFREQICLPELLRRRGLWSPLGWSDRLNYHASRLWRRVTKWRRRQSQPGASTAGLERRLAGETPTNFARSRAVALHGSLGALIYLTTSARFEGGRLTTAADYDEAAEETLAALRDARHPATGEALFETAVRLDRLADVDPLERSLPDVLAIPAPGFHTRTRCDQGRRLLCDDSQLTATHRREGVLLATGPGVNGPPRPLIAGLRDLAPTILDLLGIESLGDMDGTSLADRLAGQSRDSSRTRSVSRISSAPPALAGRSGDRSSDDRSSDDRSSDDRSSGDRSSEQPPAAWQRIDSGHAPPSPVLSSAEQAAIEDRLRQLGYME